MVHMGEIGGEMRARAFLLVTAVMLVVVSCGGDGGTTATSAAGTTESDQSVVTSAGQDTTTSVGATTTVPAAATAEDPCALATPEQVAAAFGAASASGEAGIARNCSYTLEGGIAPAVEVYHFGSSSGWDGVRSGYEENRGGTIDVDGVGEDAYYPNDFAPYELVVLSDDAVFAVAVQMGDLGPEVEAAILDLAGAIAGG
jgi:hypothetical protein